MKQPFIRVLNLELPPGQTAFLWGARKTGKSTFLKKVFPGAVYYDLLKTDELTRLMAKPHLLREELLATNKEKLLLPVIIDEIQKIPALLDEVHWLIENEHIGFILCGSSARKLKHGAANLLGGRAWRFEFYPLIYKEIPDFDLLRALNHGLLPTHYITTNPTRFLRAYIGDYLHEEIQSEALVRNLPGFARFLDVIGFSNGEMTNYKNIAQDCAIDAKTVKEYYQIMIDTLFGYYIYPYVKKPKRQIISATPKFYLFDVGVANYLARRTINELRGQEAGAAFEHYILMELLAYVGLNELDLPLCYWRSKSGMEVDFVIDTGKDVIAIEVKISSDPSPNDYKGLRAFCDDYRPKRALVVCQAPRKRVVSFDQYKIEIVPWEEFIAELWALSLL